MWEEIENQGVIAGFRSPDFITLPRRSGRTGRFQFELSRGNSRIVANQKLGAPAWNSTWASGNSGFVGTVRTIELKLVDKRIVSWTHHARLFAKVSGRSPTAGIYLNAVLQLLPPY
jgi:hypothetical protein